MPKQKSVEASSCSVFKGKTRYVLYFEFAVPKFINMYLVIIGRGAERNGSVKLWFQLY